MTAPPCEDVAVRAEGLTKRYGKTYALDDCDLVLPSGHVVALVGPNGAGKTTLLRLISGLLRPTSGRVSVLGVTAPAGTVDIADTAAALARVGYVAQEHPLYRRFTVSELLRFGRELNPGWDADLGRERLADLDIPLDRRAAELSGGQQAQVALVLALAKRPRLLVLDEPLAQLDPLARREFLSTLMAAVAEDGITVLFSSHVVSELERVCDWLVLIAGGRIHLSSDVDTLLADHRLLVGPRNGHDETLGSAEGVLTVALGARHVNVVARTGTGPVSPGWEAHPLGLEDLVHAYLQHARTAPPAPAKEVRLP
ncbi:ABC transporter ATP-binding protein [Streptomyces sp. NPDC048172]|uniref:ABC transporter ATP-binding protein n=1 Tax=Streptomyces sp. NPDC048172 TaxID=3365505 RepID=UPI003717F053